MSMRDTIAAARGKWPDILRRYGLDEKFLKNRHGPCPLCGGKDRYRFDDKDGSGSYFCQGCGAGFGFQLLARFTNRPQADLVQEVGGMVGGIEAKDWSRAAPDPRKRLTWIGRRLVFASKCPAVRAYLAGRGLKPTKHLFAIPALRYYEEAKVAGDFPAMVAPFVSPAGKLVTYHLTYIQDGRKAPVACPRKVLPPLGTMDGGAIRLTKVYPALGIAEGVETALAVMRDFGVPCWAAASAGMLEKFVPPEGVQAVTVYGDHDASFTGQRAAYALARRLKALGVEVGVKIPETEGDFADLVPTSTQKA